MNLRAMAHELGHNFGTHHASTLTCTEAGVRVSLAANAADCSTSEYGDPYTVMGQASHYEHTNYSRGNFGWLEATDTLTVTTTGDYALEATETPGTSVVRALRMARTSSSFLMLELRGPSDPFDTFATTAPAVTGVSVRIHVRILGANPVATRGREPVDDQLSGCPPIRGPDPGRSGQPDLHYNGCHVRRRRHDPRYIRCRAIANSRADPHAGARAVNDTRPDVIANAVAYPRSDAVANPIPRHDSFAHRNSDSDGDRNGHATAQFTHGFDRDARQGQEAAALLEAEHGQRGCCRLSDLPQWDADRDSCNDGLQ